MTNRFWIKANITTFCLKITEVFSDLDVRNITEGVNKVIIFLPYIAKDVLICIVHLNSRLVTDESLYISSKKVKKKIKNIESVKKLLRIFNILYSMFQLPVFTKEF